MVILIRLNPLVPRPWVFWLILIAFTRPHFNELNQGIYAMTYKFSSSKVCELTYIKYTDNLYYYLEKGSKS